MPPSKNPLKLNFIICLFIFVVTGYFAEAQLLVGPKVGVQVSKVKFQDKEYRKSHKSKFRIGYNIGGVLNYRVNKTLSLHTELNYSTKGKIVEVENPEIKNSAIYHYLDLPLLLRVSFDKKLKKETIQLYFNVGPNVGYWLGGKGKLQSGELIEYIDSDELKYKVRFEEAGRYGEHLYVQEPNRLQLELSIGGGMLLNISRGRKLMLDVRYGFGIGHTFLGKKEGGDFGLYNYKDNFQAVNNVISLSAAYLFELNMLQILRKGKSNSRIR